MIDTPAQPAARRGACGLGNLLLEALVVVAAGVAFAFLANHFSPRGLQLARNYAVDETPAASSPPAGGETLEARLKANGLQLIRLAAVEQLFHDPRLQQNAILFIDARGEDDYQQGHIPGACEFSPYYPEKYLSTVRPLCDFAEQIIVYCTGGDECPDSQAAALYLRDTTGVPGAKIFVYGGGMTEWAAAGLPVESGARNSGDIHKGGK